MNTTIAGREPNPTANLLDHDVRLGLGMDGPHAVPPAPWARGAAPAPLEDAPTPQDRALARLLGLADSYHRAGEFHQALEMYFSLMAEHPGTPEADQAEERVMEVARRHEQAGELRQARAIYERLV